MSFFTEVRVSRMSCEVGLVKPDSALANAGADLALGLRDMKSSSTPDRRLIGQVQRRRWLTNVSQRNGAALFAYNTDPPFQAFLKYLNLGISRQ